MLSELQWEELSRLIRERSSMLLKMWSFCMRMFYLFWNGLNGREEAMLVVICGRRSLKGLIAPRASPLTATSTPERTRKGRRWIDLSMMPRGILHCWVDAVNYRQSVGKYWRIRRRVMKLHWSTFKLLKTEKNMRLWEQDVYLLMTVRV